MEPVVPADPLTPSDGARAAARAGLYLHVPFCEKRCTYCDFSTGLLSRAVVERWLDALEREMAWRGPSADGLAFSSVYFGGGTPSALAPGDFDRVARALRGAFAIDAGAEFTIEANPESVREARIDAWRASGVNRLSIGVQSFEPDELARLGRLHDAERPAEALRLARAAGIERLSLDLMFGFPGHDAARWERTLDRALALGTGHVSAYAFIPEPGTELGNAIVRGDAHVADDDAQAALYERLVERCERAGLLAYETSNFARPGDECRHNLVYWLRRPYVGLGPSAHGFVAGGRYGNPYDLGAWARAAHAGTLGGGETGTPADAAREILMLALRLDSGVRRGDHSPAAWRGFEAHYGRAGRAALASGRIEGEPHAFRIPPARRFVADDVIAWIDARAGADGLTAPVAAG